MAMHSSFRLFSILKLNLLIAFACFLGGYIGIQIIMPSNHSSPIWPAAGISLACLLCYGRKALPGVFIAAIVTQAYSIFSLSGGEALATYWQMGFANGCAATLQAFLGAGLIKRTIGSHNPLLDDGSILLFMFLGGPVSCVVSASSGMLMLFLKGFLSPDLIPNAWLTWWIGDAIGVLIFAPLCLCFIAKPKQYWRPRRLSVALPLATLSVVVAALFELGKQEEGYRVTRLFNERADLMQNILQNELNRFPHVNESLKALFASSVQVTEQEFKQFSHSMLETNDNVEELQWITPQADKSSHYLVTYQLTAHASKHLIDDGLSTYTLDAAVDSGQSLAFIAHQQAASSQPVTACLFTPIYRGIHLPETQALRRQQLLGLVASCFHLDNVVFKQSFKHAHLQLLLTLTDEGQEVVSQRLESNKVVQTLPVLQKSSNLQLAGRQIRCDYQASPQFYSSEYLWNIWWLILSQFLINGLAGVGLLMLTGRNLQTERIVKDRTRALEEEVFQRKKIITERSNHNIILQAILSPNKLDEVLDVIVKSVEENYPDSYCSILLADENGICLCKGSTLGLPEFFNQAIKGLQVNVGGDCCNTASFGAKRIVIENIEQHPFWQTYSSLAKQAGIASCLLEPILSSSHHVLGALVIYHRQAFRPDQEMMLVAADYAKLASVAIEKKLYEEHIANMAFFDALTNLPNRRLFLDRLDKVLAKGTRHKTFGALLFLDLDHFKALNDNFGHDIGDELLRQVADRLKDCVREEDTVARLGGDEFVVLIDCNETTRELILERSLVMGERVQRTLQQPYQLKEHRHHVSPSIGVTILPQQGVLADALLKQADTAMYQAKHQGRNAIRYFDPLLQKQADIRQKTENELKSAVKNDQLRIFYQPQFDIDGVLIGAEAMLFWQHPEKGLLAAEDFIGIAEELGLMWVFSDWWLSEVCLQLKRWPSLPYLSVKLTAKQFKRMKIDEKLAAISNQQSHLLKRLVLEISATAIFDDAELNIAKLEAINGLSISTALSIDDFNTCCLSLSYLKNLPICQIKINQHVICNIEVDALIVETMTGMASHFGLTVVAEQIETAKQIRFLNEKGCHGYQGTFFGAPMAADEFAYVYRVVEARDELA
ncbi:hypothetical protein JCM14076_27590 [Methylosoma difficile]